MVCLLPSSLIVDVNSTPITSLSPLQPHGPLLRDYAFFTHPSRRNHVCSGRVRARADVCVISPRSSQGWTGQDKTLFATPEEVRTKNVVSDFLSDIYYGQWLVLLPNHLLPRASLLNNFSFSGITIRPSSFSQSYPRTSSHFWVVGGLGSSLLSLSVQHITRQAS